ncbi:MAG: hypothetical protein U9R54_00045 [Bacteroidota bacterium]|nr:hypothetical protein [Bacteroidota bacterium]
MRKLFTLLLLLSLNFWGYTQEVYHHLSNTSIYEFLDEMATLKIIELNSAIKPYSRMLIAEKLNVIHNNNSELNQRQKKELVFYLKDFNKEIKTNNNFKKRLDLYSYKDSFFTLTINPIGGIEYMMNDSGTYHHRWNGAEAWAYIGKHFGAYASLRDNHETTVLTRENTLNQRMTGNYKGSSDGGGDYSEMRGGITYSWKWGSASIIKDHFEWGTNYNGANIFSGRIPSFAQIKLHLKPTDWFEFNYVHGWLVSEVVDSTNSYIFSNSYGTDRREVFHDKYIAANMFTLTPFKNFKASIGNSVIYSDDGVKLQYLNPVMFYKSIDHTYNATDSEGRNVGQNSQMFFDISSRNIKNVHLYSTLFVDELSVDRFFKDEESNFWSLKLGLQIANLIPNTFITAEYLKSTPLTYKHNIPTTTFESNGYNLGHYLMDNSKEFYFAVSFRPLRGLNIKIDYLDAKKGKDYDSSGDDRLGLPYIETVEWENKSFSIQAKYQIINDGYIFFKYLNSNIQGDLNAYTPEMFHGKQNTLSMGINYGF